MDLFFKIEGAVAIVRFKGGILKQKDMYVRGDRVFIPHNGGFLRVTQGFDGEYGTVNPDIKVIEFEAEGVSGKDPRYNA